LGVGWGLKKNTPQTLLLGSLSFIQCIGENARKIPPF